MPSAPEWRSVHLYYHADRDLLIRSCVADALRKWLQDELVESWFFVRLSVGGPHVRLRFKPAQAVDPEIPEAGLRVCCERFFQSHPSTETIEADRIREHNAYVRRFDPTEMDDTVFPDNSLQVMPFSAEVERYGGDDLIAHSLDYFCLSSAQVLHELLQTDGPTPGRRLSLGFQLLVRQAAGFAVDVEELSQLIAYPPSMDAVYRKAEAAYGRSRATYLALLKRELLSLTERAPLSGRPYPVFAGARRLRACLEPLPVAEAQYICRSQLHMTANRLGLENREETYLSRLVSLAVEDLRELEPGLWNRVSERLTGGSGLGDSGPEDPGLADSDLKGLDAPITLSSLKSEALLHSKLELSGAPIPN